MLYYRVLESPAGPLTLVSSGDVLLSILFRDHLESQDYQWLEKHVGRTEVQRGREARPLRLAAQQLESYFQGRLQQFDLPVHMHGTPFQKQVWERLLHIPYGSTISYGELATELHSSARAVGRANGKNPLPIVVPCHRVIAADGTLCGFGGGLSAKSVLLRLEGAGFVDEEQQGLWI